MKTKNETRKAPGRPRGKRAQGRLRIIAVEDEAEMIAAARKAAATDGLSAVAFMRQLLRHELRRRGMLPEQNGETL